MLSFKMNEKLFSVDFAESLLLLSSRLRVERETFVFSATYRTNATSLDVRDMRKEIVPLFKLSRSRRSFDERLFVN